METVYIYEYNIPFVSHWEDEWLSGFYLKGNKSIYYEKGYIELLHNLI